MPTKKPKHWWEMSNAYLPGMSEDEGIVEEMFLQRWEQERKRLIAQKYGRVYHYVPMKRKFIAGRTFMVA